MIDGGLTVFTAGRDFCLMEMVREVCEQYAEHKITLDEFIDCYETIMLQAAENEIKATPKGREDAGLGADPSERER